MLRLKNYPVEHLKKEKRFLTKEEFRGILAK